jgi:hypothetical protein
LYARCRFLIARAGKNIYRFLSTLTKINKKYKIGYSKNPIKHSTAAGKFWSQEISQTIANLYNGKNWIKDV